jgi:hypothetical protein
MRNNDADAVRRASYGMFVGNIIAGRFDRAVTSGTQLLDFAHRKNDHRARIIGHRMLGTGCAMAGDLLSAEDHLGKTIELFRHVTTWDSSGSSFVHNPGKTAMATLAAVRWSRGFPDEARQLAEAALDAADQERETNTTGYTMLWRGILHLLMRAPEVALRQARHVVRFAEERGSRFPGVIAEWIEGAALVELGQAEVGLSKLIMGRSHYAAQPLCRNGRKTARTALSFV